MTSQIEIGRYLELEPVTGGLKVRLTKAGRRELKRLESNTIQREDELFAALSQDFAGNGWQLIDPSTMGLTACRLGISPDAGELETVYWHERYAVEDAIEQLKSGELFLMLARGE